MTGRGFALLCGAVVLVLSVLFGGAMWHALPPVGSDVLLVFAEPVVGPGGPWGVRVVAADAARHTRAERAPITVTLAGERAAVRGQTAVLPAPDAPGTYLATVERAGARVQRVQVPVVVADHWPRGEQPHWTPWTDAVEAGTPAYPVDGRAVSDLDSLVVRVKPTVPGTDAVQLVVERVAGATAGMALADGRGLNTAKHGLQLRVPRAVAPGASAVLTVVSDAARHVYVDIVVDGRTRGMHEADLVRGANTLRLPVPARTAVGAMLVWHVAESPLALRRGQTAVSRVVRDRPGARGESEARWLVDRLEYVGGGADPLLRAVSRGQVSITDDVFAALTARLWHPVVRPARLGMAPLAQLRALGDARAAAFAVWRRAFRGAAVFTALGAAFVLARLIRGRREAWVLTRDADGAGGELPDAALRAVPWAGIFAASVAAGALWVADLVLGMMERGVAL